MGEGAVLAAVFGVSSEDIEQLAQAVARPPRDPRFRISFQIGRRLGVAVEAAAADGAFLNGEKLSLELAGDAGQKPTLQAIPQTAPGRYELSLASPAAPTLATVRLDGRALDRVAVAGRYAPEFEAVGNDGEALEELATLSGGKVIAPTQHTPIDFHWPPRDVSLASWLAMGGALLLSAGLVMWRRS